MSLRPLDMQVMIPKSQKISQIKRIEQHRPVAEQQLVGEQIQKSHSKQLKRVPKNEKEEKMRWRKKPKDRREQSGQDKSKQQKDKDEKNKPLKHIDIEI